MDITTQYAAGAFALIGFVNGINFALDKEWKSFIKFLTAVVAGALLGFFHLFGVPSLEIGLLLGLASSGVYKTAQVLKGA